MEYKIVSEREGYYWITDRYDVEEPRSLEGAVNTLIQQGWEPIGGVSAISTGLCSAIGSVTTGQAMILRSEASVN